MAEIPKIKSGQFWGFLFCREGMLARREGRGRGGKGGKSDNKKQLEPLFCLRGHCCPVLCVSFHPSRSVLASGFVPIPFFSLLSLFLTFHSLFQNRGEDGTLKIWSLKLRRCILSLSLTQPVSPKDPTGVLSVSFSSWPSFSSPLLLTYVLGEE